MHLQLFFLEKLLYNRSEQDIHSFFNFADQNLNEELIIYQNQITLSTSKQLYEGQNLIINGEITNPTIKNIYYKFSDASNLITSSDLVSDSLSGSTVIDNNGNFNITESIRLDLKTEYTENLYISFFLDKDLKQRIKNVIDIIEI